MDLASLTRRGERVSRIFDALATAVAVVGGLATLVVLLTAFTNASGEFAPANLLVAVAVAIYTVLTWAGVQLASLVAGYIAFRTTAAPASPGKPIEAAGRREAAGEETEKPQGSDQWRGVFGKD